MKKILLTISLSLMSFGNAFASAPVEMRVEKNGGQLKIINNRNQTGFIEYGGGKNAWSVKYMADPGTHTITGEGPGCSTVTQTAFFEEGKTYRLVLTDDCRIQ